MLPHQEKIPYKRTKNTLREHQEILQSFTLLLQERLPSGIKITREKWERMRESGERFWYNGVTVKLNVKMRRRGFLLKEGKMREPSWMSYKCHPSKRENKSRGVHF
jgi:hypothetical protein